MPRNVIYQYVKDLTSGRISSGFNHCNRVYHLARELGAEKYDDEILYAACFLHDIIIGGEKSNEKSSEKAEQILHETGFPVEKISTVVSVIKSYTAGSKPEIIEAKMLHDANLLDSLGAIGMVRISISSIYNQDLKSMKDIKQILKDYRKKSDFLIFDKSKELAKKKLEFMDEAMKELDEEENL